MFDEESGNIAEINIYGRLTQFEPVLDLNGGDVDGINYAVTFSEGRDTSLHIVDDEVFITDEDIDPHIVNITVNLTNAQLDTSQEFLSLSQDAPQEVQVIGENTHTVVLLAQDFSTTRDFFITTLFRLRYSNTADEPGGEERVIQFTISDGRLTNNPIAETTISIMEVNDVPVIDLNGDDEGTGVVVEYTEADPPTLIVPQATLQDPDSPTFTQLTIDFEPFDIGNESLSVDLSVLPSGSSITCNISPCRGTSLVFTGIADNVDYQSLLRTLSYVNTKRPIDLPNLSDRFITVQVSDGESLSASGTEIQIDFLANQSRVIIQLDVPNQDFFTMYTEGQGGSISVVGAQIRIVDTSLDTLQSVDLTIRNNLPGGVRERDEVISIDTSNIAHLQIGLEIHAILKKITFSGEAPLEDYLMAIRNVRYRNTQDEPIPMARYIDFVVDPGGGAPRDFAFTNISIINVNDHSPVCDPEVQTALVREDTKPGEHIYTLVATDADVGVGAKITYEQIEGNSSLFSTSSSGDVSLLDNVDFEGVKGHSIVVEACNDGIVPDRFCCRFTLDINITDFNDEVPMFSQPSYLLSVEENLVTDITTFTINDNDSGTNADIVEMAIVTSSYSPVSRCMGLFSVSVNPPTLSTVAPGLDHETRTSCQFTITATDGGGADALTGSATVTVTITNVDDFPPVFSMESFTFNVVEENTVPLVVGTVEADDVDSPSFVYSLQNAQGFAIDESLGNVTILFSTNHDIATSHTFDCVATDPNSNIAIAEVVVIVNPINNDPPTLDLNATDPDTENVRTPVVFMEESGEPVSLVTDPIITDPDEVTLVISEIQARVANSENPSEEELSLPQSVSSLYTDISPADNSVFVIEPVNPTQLDDVYELIQSIRYINHEDEISPCNQSLHPCALGTNSRTILIRIRDGVNYSPEREVYVTFEAVNDPPQLDLNTVTSGTGHRTVYQEGHGAVFIVNVGFVSVADDDHAVLTSLECTLTNPTDGSDEFLVLSGTLSNELTPAISSDGYTITINGAASTSTYAEAISLIQYNSTTSDPTDVPREIDCYVSDGIATSDVATAEVLFDTVNQMPTLDLDDQSATVNYSANYVEEGGAVRIAGNVVLEDTDDTDMASLTVTLIDASTVGENIALDSSYTLPSTLTASSTGSGLMITGLAPIITYVQVISNVVYNNTDTEISDTSDRLAHFTVRDDDGAESEPAYAIISITPVDDNPPAFEDVADDFYIFENVTDDAQVGLLRIIDMDEPPGRDAPTFSITPASDPTFGTSDFYVVNNPANLYEAIIHVSDGDVIDYDNRAICYYLEILAVSGFFSVNITVKVTVTNLPDLNPVFTIFPLTFRVFENEIVNTLLSPPSVMAVDPDDLDTIEYDISGNELQGVPLVDLDSTSGNLTVVGHINREVHGSEFQINITARDSNSMTTQSATVEILGINEFEPQFSQSTYIPSVIVENAAPSPAALVQVSATDTDEISEELNITYAIRQGDGSSLFRINSTTGEVFQVLPVDYEVFGATITLVIEANDNDISPMEKTSTATINVPISNDNDESPIFNNLPHSLVVSELTPLHSRVFEVDFSDPDVDRNLQFSPLMSDIFAIVHESEQVAYITNTDSLDADTGPRQYTLVIELTDLNTESIYSSQRNISAQLNITVEDRNDLAPIFSSDVFQGEVMENLSPGQSIVQVTATDGDYGFTPNGDMNGNNIVEYLLDTDAPNGVFSINNETGLITSNMVLNREEQAEYTFTVIARDSPVDDSFNMHTVRVRIRVIDENEHLPEADPDQYYIFVEENTQSSLQTFVASQWSTEGMHIYLLGKIRNMSC